jgi:micrococcal nuclease
MPGVSWARSSRTVTVIATTDGDTVQVQDRKETYAVRLACIDAPERLQAGGLQATTHLRELLPEGTQVKVDVVETEAEQPIVEIFKDGQSVNLQMVREGMAVIYPRQFQPCYSNRHEYYQAQAEARQQQKGLWAQTNPLMPWEWRQRNRSPLRTNPNAIAQAYPVQER